MDIAIFENEDKTLGIVNPMVEALKLFDLKTIAEKSTPLGLPFWLRDESVIPIDGSDRNAWRLDGTQGEPDGWGKKARWNDKN